MGIKELLEKLKAKGWGDTFIADELGVDPSTVYRWRMGISSPYQERLVIQVLERLLRRRRVPTRRKETAGIGPAV